MRNKFERRDCADRRQDEVGPPSGWKDRRRRTERRIPELDECEVSETEWLAYFGGADKPAQPASGVAGNELSAEVFDRIRN
ncbi:MAG: hypothetical protein CVU34_12625 [Betaproteobacteria bacterium HGW-Betaproteobacteria-7]|nr:MAG: hypothetical protein CVU34_12625 [Betaproteobacteria bacterium HGW-Betaproteobacteria-7]